MSETTQFKKFATENNNVDYESLMKINSIDYMIFAYYCGQLDFAKKTNLLKLYEVEEFKNAKITTLGIIDDFARKFNIDYGTITQRTLYNKLYKMIRTVNGDFFSC